MALIKCTECGKEISSNAKTCPNCGNTIKQGEIEKEITATISIAKKLAIVLIVVLSIIIVFFFVTGYLIPAHTYYNQTTNKSDFRLFRQLKR